MNNNNEQLIVIKTIEELNKLNDYLNDKDFIAYDTETDGLHKGCKVIGFSVCCDINVGYYVILSYWDVEKNELIDLETKDHAINTLNLLKTKQLIMHNAVFDCRVTRDNFGVDLMPQVHTDTMIASHLLDENRHNGLKELGVSIFGEDATKEQKEMKESVIKNGGVLTKDNYELYKADADLIARYGAKDTILTLKLFYHFTPQLIEEGLDSFFYDQESMPLLRGPTYDLSTSGLRIDPDKLIKLKGELEADCLEAKAYILKEIAGHVSEKYPGTTKANHFNIGASKQLSWLLFIKLENEFGTLTDGGKEICKALQLKLPYSYADKRHFLTVVRENLGKVYEPARMNPKTKKMGRPKKVAEAWHYLKADKLILVKLSKKYRWVEKLLEYSKNQKLLNTYVKGIEARMKYNIIFPDFRQHGTTSGRYACRNPNFQNLPRGDKRIKAFITARPGKVFVGADYSQLEPRVFASVSGDEQLMGCFARGEDFYSVVGAPIFGKEGCSLIKDDKDSFATLHPDLRDKSKVVSLATPYGRTANQQATVMGISRDESQELIDAYFSMYPKVEKMMLSAHEEAKDTGRSVSMFGRPRRIPAAADIRKIYGKTQHKDLPYEIRTLLNLAMNHKVQSAGASIVNRATIAIWDKIRENNIQDCKIILQVHDELIIECKEEDGPLVALLLQEAMENTTVLPGVSLEAVPKIGKTLADLK